MAQSLANLRAEAQQRSNQENKTLVSTAEGTRYVNEAISELYDLIVTLNPHYYVKSYPFTLSSVNTLDLTTVSSGSSTFYKLRGVDYFLSTSQQPMTVTEFNFQERNRYWNQNFAGSYTLWFTPPPPALAADGDTLDFILDVWSEYVAVRAAISYAVKEESGELAESLATMLGRVEARIRAAAASRSGMPKQAADLTTRMRSDCGRRYSLEGANLVILGATYGSDVWGT